MPEQQKRGRKPLPDDVRLKRRVLWLNEADYQQVAALVAKLRSNINPTDHEED